MLTEKFIEKNFPKGKRTLVGSRPVMGKTSFSISLTISLTNRVENVSTFQQNGKNNS